MLPLLWFTRDPRLADYPVLARAAAARAVLPVGIVEPGLWRAPVAATRQRDSVAEAGRVLRRHAGRRDARDRGANDRIPRRPDPAQRALDL